MNKQAIKVLAVVSQLNRGGLEQRLMDIIRNIDFDRVQLDIFTYRLEPGIMDEEAAELGSKIYYNKPLTVKNMIEYIYYFADFLRKHPEYKIVHAHQDAWCSVFCMGAKFAEVPVRIAHSRTAITSGGIKNLMKNVIKMPTRRYATHYFAVSDLAGEWLFGKKNSEKGKVQIWHNAIESSKYKFNEERRREKRKELQIENKFVVLHVGNFTPPKNHDKIIKVFYEVSRRRADTILLLAGNELNSQARLLVQKLQIVDKVIFLGSREDVNELLWSADVFLFPSFFEGMPGAVIEAQAAGLPCIVSDSVTKEICITPLVKQIPLTLSDADWAEEVLDIKKVERVDTFEIMCKAGYDINMLIEKLTLFYENVLDDYDKEMRRKNDGFV